MCGIFGYIGGRSARDVIIKGLKYLEYRGYDSAGIALFNEGKIDVSKKAGRIAVLEEALKGKDDGSGLGIGHTRWATHGKPSDGNAHPFLAEHNKFAVVHNGIIENYLEIKEELEEKRYRFFSQTDSEVVANLIDSCYAGDTLEAILKAVKRLKGSYALGILSIYDKDTLFAVKKDSPLIVGFGEAENYICSDINSLQYFTDKVAVLENRQIAVIKTDGVTVKNSSGAEDGYKIIDVKMHENIELEANAEPFMRREIKEIPRVLAETYERLAKIDTPALFPEEYLKNLKRIYITGCGTALHAGLCAKVLLRKYCKLDVISDYASEFKHGNYMVDGETLTVAVSQSGETADTLAAVEAVREAGGKVLSVTNVPTSTLTAKSDAVFPTHAGPEISVASTKAYNCQLMALFIFVLRLALLRGEITKAEFNRKMKALAKTAKLAEDIIKTAPEKAERFARRYFDRKSVFFIGRGGDFNSAAEGSLKLKEISYINSEAYASGELKHGTLALIEPAVLVVAVITQTDLLHKSFNAVSEVKARGAQTLAVTQFKDAFLKEYCDGILPLPASDEDFMPILAAIPMQLFAYHMALCRGCDIDKPRNLAKSVTVE